MKKLKPLISLSLLLFPLVTMAYEEIGGIYYELSGSEATVVAGTTKYSGSVVIPEDVSYNWNLYRVTSIGSAAFSFCSNLTSVTIPSSIKDIGSEAFSFCTSLTSVTIPASVTSIGYGAFWDCYNLSYLSVNKFNTKYDSRNDCNAIIETSSNKLIAGCANTFIPNGVTAISDGAFMDNKLLTSISIPNSVRAIGAYAFLGCSSLTSVSVKWFTPLAIGANDVSNRANSTLYVPFGCKSVYEATAYWNEFKEIIEEPGIMGDVNGDGAVDLSDAIMVTYHSLHETPSYFNTGAADMNADGEIDLSDAIIIIYKSLGVK